MRPIHRRYLREFFTAMGAYVVLIVLYGALAPRLPTSSWRFVLAIAPLLPVTGVIRAVVRLIRDEDELERRIDLEAFAIAAMVTGFGFFSYGLLLSVGAFPAPPAFLVAILVMPGLFGSYGLARWAVSRRYART
ncbi:hypothetical protein ISP17_17900 [Dyella ginsengisoli]|uniref:Transmembrane protein n=2 Tax=Dyella ginsengisoli TaxID=363848 RepID=A0ABW8JXE1_9GAMM